MQSSRTYHETSSLSLGERRGIPDLAQFSLNLSWARAVSDSARSRAYPSPPMSGSPPIPPKFNPDPNDRGHVGYGPGGQAVYQGGQPSQSEQADLRRPPVRAYHPEILPPAYPPPRMEENPPAAIQYQQQQRQAVTPQMFQQQPMPYQQSHAQPPTSYAGPERPPTGGNPEFSSPKAQRKTKGHVASACVPCKRAHLRCDAQRPCSRCLANGKEDACVDVQHKKRGRPRLRDEREQRYEAMGQSGSGYPHSAEGSMRRPLSMYSTSAASMNPDFGDSMHRSGSYRVLKSQGGPIAPRFLEHASVSDANISGGFMMPAPRMPTQEPLCAYLTTKMQVAKATQSFNELIGMPGGVVSRNLGEIFSANDREKVARLQITFEEERRQREPHLLPPIVLGSEEQSIIQSVGFGIEEAGQWRLDHHETFTIQGLQGQQQTFQARLGLVKRDATYFIVLILYVPAPATQQSFQPPAMSPYSRDSYSRGSQYEHYQPQSYPQSQAPPPFMVNPGYLDPRAEQMGYRAPPAVAPNIHPSASIPPYSQAPPRPDYAQAQTAYQTPRNEQPQTQPQRQNDLQLPPIRDQRSEASVAGPGGRRDDRANRVDIGGLLENPRTSRG